MKVILEFNLPEDEHIAISCIKGRYDHYVLNKLKDILMAEGQEGLLYTIDLLEDEAIQKLDLI